MSDYQIHRVYGPWLTDPERKTLQAEHESWIRAVADTYGDTIKGYSHVWEEVTVPVAGTPVKKFQLTSNAILASTAATS